MTIEQVPVELMGKLGPLAYQVAISNLALSRELELMQIYRDENLIKSTQALFDQIEASVSHLVNGLDAMKRDLQSSIHDLRLKVTQEMQKTTEINNKLRKDQSNEQTSNKG